MAGLCLFGLEHVAVVVFNIDCFGLKTILGAVSFISNIDDVFAITQLFIDIAIFRLELLNGRKDHASFTVAARLLFDASQMIRFRSFSKLLGCVSYRRGLHCIDFF